MTLHNIYIIKKLLFKNLFKKKQYPTKNYFSVKKRNRLSKIKLQ